MTEQIRVLYIDDDPYLLDIAKQFLDQVKNFTITPIDNPAEAILLHTEKAFDAIVSDYEMDRMDGIELLKHLREKGDTTPFIIFTEKGREEVVIEAINNGVDFYLQKGGNPTAQFAELSNKIHYAVARRRSERDIVRKNKELQAAYEQISGAEEQLRVHLRELTRQESLIRINEERLLMAQEIGQSGCWEYNLETGHIWGSAEALSIYGFPPIAGDFPVDEIETCIPDHGRIHQALVNLVTEGREYNLEYLVYPANGSSPRMVHSIARLEKDEFGNPNRVIGVFQDITGKKDGEIELQKKNFELQSAYEQISASEEELRANLDVLSQQEHLVRESKDQFQSLYMNMIEGSALHSLIYNDQNIPEDYIIIETNPAFNTQLGISRDAVIGKTSREAYGVAEPPYLETYARVSLTGDPEVFETYFPPLDKYFSISVYCPYKGSFATIFEDITIRKRTEENLRQAKEYLDNLISIANVPIIIWDPSFIITRLNHAFEYIIGRPAEEVIGKSLEFLFPPDQTERSMRLFQTTHEGVRWETVEIDILHRDGSVRTILWNSATLYTHDGRTPVATIAQGRDVSDERILEKDKDTALVQIQQNLAQLAILNDEIRNPLTIITLYADKFEDTRITELVIEQTERIDIMVNQLDRRWMESEKVLNAIRKHYQIHVDPPSGQERADKADIDQPGTLREKEPPSQRKNEILIEEVQAQLYTILDSIDALVYVADMDTYEILFINQRGRSRFGDIIGQKCYKTLQRDQDKPCPFCTNKLLTYLSQPTGVYQWEFQNPQNGRWYDCRDRAIRWTDGRLVRLEIATDISEIKEAEENIRISESRIHRKLDALLSPDGEIEAFHLTDIIDVPTIQKLMDDFHSLTGILVAILDLKGNILVAAGWQDICIKFHRTHPDSCKNCIESDTILSKGVPPGTYKLYRCKNNLWDIATPILVGGTHLGNLFLGQFFFEDEEPDYSVFRTQAKQYAFDEEAYIAALEKVPRLSRETVDAVMQYYIQFIHLITQVSWSNIKLARAVHERDELLISVQESEEKFRRYIDNAPNGVFISNEEGCYLEVNPAACKITGYTEHELLQMQIVDLLPRESFEVAKNHFDQVVKQGKANGEFLFRKKDGSLRYWSVDAVQISPTRFMGFVQDISERKLGEESLRISERKYRQLIEYANDGIVVTQKDMLQLANPRMEELTGYSREDLLSVPFITFIHPDDQAMVLDRYQKRLKGEESPSRYVFRLIRKDGCAVWMEISAVAVEWEGSPATLNFLIDITGRRKIEEDLRTSEGRLRTIVQTIPDLIWLKDKDGVYLSCNPMFERFFGARESDIIGKTDFDFLDRDQADFFREHDQNAMAMGQPTSNEEWITFSDDGHRAFLETIKTPMYDAGGMLIGVLGIGRDISERKQVENELRLIQTRLESAMDAGDIAWWEMDSITGAVIFNERKALMLGYPIEQFSHYSDFTTLVHPDDHEIIMQEMRDHLTGVKDHYDVDYRIRAKNGEYFWFHDIGKISDYSPDGRPLKILGLVINITNRKRGEEALQEANRKLRLLTSLTRHDIFNQLSAVELFQNLALQTSDPEKIHEYLSHAREAGKQIERTIGFTREYEDFGIVSSGWQRIHHVIELAKDELSPGDLAIENLIPGDIEVFADPILRKVFTTLIENAVRHGERISYIRFSCFVEDTILVIIGEDDGVGVLSEEKDLIFDHGYGKHTGIGLFLAREILSITGLSILECGVPGNGARFEIFVPEGKFRRTTAIK